MVLRTLFLFSRKALASGILFFSFSMISFQAQTVGSVPDASLPDVILPNSALAENQGSVVDNQAVTSDVLDGCVIGNEESRLRIRKIVLFLAKHRIADFLLNFAVRAYGDKLLFPTMPKILDKFEKDNNGAEDQTKPIYSKSLCIDLKSAIAIFLLKESVSRVGNAVGFGPRVSRGVLPEKDPSLASTSESEVDAQKDLLVDFGMDCVDVLSDELGDLYCDGDLSNLDKVKEMLKKKVFLQKYLPFFIKACMKSSSAQQACGVDLAAQKWQSTEKVLYVLAKYILPKVEPGSSWQTLEKVFVKILVEVLKKRFDVVGKTSKAIENYIIKSSYTNELLEKVISSALGTYLMASCDKIAKPEAVRALFPGFKS